MSDVHRYIRKVRDKTMMVVLFLYMKPLVAGFYQNSSGPCCSKLTTSLVNVLLDFQKLISQICQYFLSKKCEKLLQCKSFSHFFNKKYQYIWLYSPKTLNELSS